MVVVVTYTVLYSTIQCDGRSWSLVAYAKATLRSRLPATAHDCPRLPFLVLRLLPLRCDSNLHHDGRRHSKRERESSRRNTRCEAKSRRPSSMQCPPQHHSTSLCCCSPPIVPRVHVRARLLGRAPGLLACLPRSIDAPLTPLARASSSLQKFHTFSVSPTATTT